MILIIDNGSSKVPDIVVNIEKAGLAAAVKKIEELTPENTRDYDGFILSGGPVMISEIDQTMYLTQGRMLLDQKKPTLGICLGHQIISITEGAIARMGTEDRDWREIEILENHPIFNGFDKVIRMTQDHCEEVTVPKDYRLLAKSETCPVEAIIHQDLPFVGVQFHPETSEENGQRFFNNFLRHFDLLSK